MMCHYPKTAMIARPPDSHGVRHDGPPRLHVGRRRRVMAILATSLKSQRRQVRRGVAWSIRQAACSARGALRPPTLSQSPRKGLAACPQVRTDKLEHGAKIADSAAVTLVLRLIGQGFPKNKRKKKQKNKKKNKKKKKKGTSRLCRYNFRPPPSRRRRRTRIRNGVSSNAGSGGLGHGLPRHEPRPRHCSTAPRDMCDPAGAAATSASFLKLRWHLDVGAPEGRTA